MRPPLFLVATASGVLLALASVRHAFTVGAGQTMFWYGLEEAAVTWVMFAGPLLLLLGAVALAEAVVGARVHPAVAWAVVVWAALYTACWALRLWFGNSGDMADLYLLFMCSFVSGALALTAAGSAWWAGRAA